jgi:hypothetical protein
MRLNIKCNFIGVGGWFSALLRSGFRSHNFKKEIEALLAFWIQQREDGFKQIWIRIPDIGKWDVTVLAIEIKCKRDEPNRTTVNGLTAD